MLVCKTASVRLYLVCLIGILTLSMASCGGNGDNGNEDPQNQTSEMGASEPDKASADGQEALQPAEQPPTTVRTEGDSVQAPIKPPLSSSYLVLDPQTNTVYELNRTTGEIIRTFRREAPVVAIAHDTEKNLLYESVGGDDPGLNVFDLAAHEDIEKLDFPEPPSDMFFHPTQRRLYIASEDSSSFRVFDPDSMKFIFDMKMRIHDQSAIGPKTLEVGPLNKLVSANGKRASVTQIFTEQRYMYQTVVLHEAYEVTSAAFSFDGNSAFVTDTEQGAIFRVEFGSGKYLAEKYGLVRPRLVQFEVGSRTVCVVENDIEVAFYNPDSFAETGRVNLNEYGERIIAMDIPPKANYAEVLLDYKGVTRWLIVDIKNWEMLRFAELI